jgi:Tol biopolymer transport system component
MCDAPSAVCVPATADAGPPRLDGGTTDDAQAIDAAVPLFDRPVAVAALNGTDDDNDPTLTGDELEIIFTSTRGGDEDLWTARRDTLASPWQAPVLVTELSSRFVETDAELSSDGLHLFFTSTRAGDQDEWETTRATRGSTWAAPIRVVDLSSADEDCCAVLGADGLRVVFASARAGADMDLFEASRADTTGAWGSIVRLAELDTSSAESNPFWTDGETTLLFDSNRPGGAGGRDIYLATRPTRDGTFGGARAIDSLSTTFDDRDVWVSEDGQRVWLASDLGGSYDLYVSSRR